jgi:N-acetylmuramoyl-L-alanine amidase
MSYEIIQNFIPGLPEDPYRYGVGAYEGVVGHSTDDLEAPALNVRNFETTHYNEAFVHFGVDWLGIYQFANTKYICYGAGHNANQRFVSVELCETKDPAKFKASYARYVWLLAKILFDRKLGVVESKTFWTHADVTKAWPQDTTHTDPVEYLKSHGVSVAQLVADVKAQYNAMAKPVQIASSKPAPAPQVSGSAGLVTVLVSSLFYYNKPDWNAKAGTVTKGEAFTVVGTLTVNGSKMYKLKSGNYITANPQYVKFTAK